MLSSENDIYSIAQTPTWVKEHSVADIVSPSDSPFHYPLVDYQECISANDIQSYRNTYQCVYDASRIEDASLYLTELHQGSQRLIIHEVSIIREGTKIDALDSENISAIQRERSLESHIVDNRITVSVSVDDLRVGDHVQYRATLVEKQTDHPFHGRHFSTRDLSITQELNKNSLKCHQLRRKTQVIAIVAGKQLIRAVQEQRPSY